VAQDANHCGVIVDQQNAEFLLNLHTTFDRRL
jgi:hypothetical protein